MCSPIMQRGRSHCHAVADASWNPGETCSVSCKKAQQILSTNSEGPVILVSPHLGNFVGATLPPDTMTMPITALFGGLLVLLCAGMSLTLGLTRANNGVMFGSGGKVG